MLKLTTGVSLLCAFCLLHPAPSQASASAAPTATVIYRAPAEVIARIRDEGLRRSQAMSTISYLTDVIGPRLTASQSMKRANEWTRDAMTRSGLQNARLEAWGPFGRGWALQKFEAKISAPYDIPLMAYPKAWSPATKGAVTGEVVHLKARREIDLSLYKGRLKNKIVLISAPRAMATDFAPVALRWTDEDLKKLANDPLPTPAPTPTATPVASTTAPVAPAATATATPTGTPRVPFSTTRMLFLQREGAAVIVDNSSKGSGGTIFVAGATAPQDVPLKQPDFRGRTVVQPYHREAQSRMLPQITLASEHYNRIVRMIGRGQKVSMTVEIQSQYQDADPMGYNTTAEIPGSDLKDEVVMLGGHLDSWHAGTGATDNAVGAVVAMEAARIIQSLGLKPRRTIRVALWSGEEQGLLGSMAYVKAHLGEMTEPKPPAKGAPEQKSALIKAAGYDKLSAYYNMDNGTGKFRGIYAQNNTQAAPIFQEWLKPFADLGATTVTLRNTGSTDHIAFDRIGLPGFQFIQDGIDYFPRTHHSNQDVFDRIQPEDVKQAATIMAAFVYQTAMMDEKMPRKPLP